MKDLFYERKYGNEKKKFVLRENYWLFLRISRRDGCLVNNFLVFSKMFGY